MFLDYGKLLLLLTINSRVVCALNLFYRIWFHDKKIEEISGNTFQTPTLFIFEFCIYFAYLYQLGVPFVFSLLI